MVETASFTVLDPTTTYTLNIYNGGLQDDQTIGDFVSSSEIKINGTVVAGPSNFNQNVSTLTIPVTLQASNTLSVELRGKPGGVLTLEIIGDDNTPPVITATANPLPNPAGWHHTPVTVSFGCTDATSGILLCPDPITIATDGASQVVSGTATDNAGNTAFTTVTLAIDQTPPVIGTSLFPLPNASDWHNADVTVSFNASDALSGLMQATQPFTVSTEGANQLIQGTATDIAGNSTAASATVNLDKTPPAVAITSPPDGATVADPALTATGTSTDTLSGLAAVTCNGQPATLTNETFSCNLTLVNGPNPINIQATDVAGNPGSAAITVALASDTTPPTITVISPQPNSLVVVNPPTIALGFSDDDSGVDTATLAFTANGNPITVTCASLTATGAECTPTNPLPEGPITLVVSLADQAGNAGSTQLPFTLDSVPVAIAITNPASGLITNVDQIAVTGTTGADVASVEVNGVPAAASGGGFSATVPLREGTNMLVAVATKANGKTGTASIDVTRDIVAPIVRIDSPRDGFVSVSKTIAVTGLVNDIVNGATNAQVLVNGKVATVAQGAFMIMDIPLGRGPNTIEAVATDAVDNVGSHTITVNFQPATGARLAEVSGNGQTAQVNQALAAPLVVVIKDELGNPVAGRVVTFDVTRNSGTLQAGTNTGIRTLQVPTNGSGQAQVFLTLGDTAGGGNNRVRATALGVAGEVEFCASGQAATPDMILMVLGDNQRGVVGHPLATPLEAMVIDKDGNPIEGIPVTFAVTQGTGNLDGQTNLVRNTGLDGVARVAMTLGVEPGLNNNIVTATTPGLTGLPATYIASGLAPGDPAQTRLSGVVLDNSHTPIPGAQITIPTTTLTTTTDTEGQFLLTQVPVGHLTLAIDPSGSPRPETFPPLAFETVTVAGQNNTIGQPILIPALQTDSSKLVGGNQDVTLSMPGVAGLGLTVFANSVTCPDGSSQCQVTISQVHLDKVPMPPPNGSLFMPPAWTIQPAGTSFNPPAKISIPNDGLPPGRVIDIFQFDHTLNEFINVGKGTVSDDASVIISDPGFGITRAGWGGGRPPPQPRSTNEAPGCPLAGNLILVNPIQREPGTDIGLVVPPPSKQQPLSDFEKLSFYQGGDGKFSLEGKFRTNEDGTPKIHDGFDSQGPVGTRVRAMAGGVIEDLCQESICTVGGNIVTINHGNNIYTRYYHLAGFASGLKKGDTVGPGQTIGAVGVSGNATLVKNDGTVRITNIPHVHVTMRKNAPFGKEIDGRPKALDGNQLDPTGCFDPDNPN